MTKISIVLTLFSLFIKLYTSMEIWKDRGYNFLDYDEMGNFEEKCSDNEICQNSFDEIIKRKSKESKDAPFPSNINGKKSSRAASYYHSSRPMPCSCGIEFRLLDLGPQYYPRYLHTGVCKSDVCRGLYRCVERHYKVRVLKQRDPISGSEIKTSMSFPDNFKGIWQPESITVTVACECSL